MRTMASSAVDIWAARALQSSGLAQPVGPRNRNEAIADSDLKLTAREALNRICHRRDALLAEITRLCSSASECSSFSDFALVHQAGHRIAGTWRFTSAMSSWVTSSRNRFFSPVSR